MKPVDPDPDRVRSAAPPDVERLADRAADPEARIGRWMLLGMWVLLLGLGTLFAQRALDARFGPVESVGPGGAAQLELRADARGHYSVTALVDGEPVEFLIDTGATGITLPADVAERIGLARGRSFATRTANGTGRSYATRLSTLRVGPFERRDVAASITPGARRRPRAAGQQLPAPARARAARRTAAAARARGALAGRAGAPPAPRDRESATPFTEPIGPDAVAASRE